MSTSAPPPRTSGLAQDDSAEQSAVGAPSPSASETDLGVVVGADERRHEGDVDAIATRLGMDVGRLRPTEARRMFREGVVTPTAGWSAGFAQANLISVPRDIAFDVRDIRAGYNFSRRVPLEPSADLVGICTVYAATKDAPRVRSSALFLNKSEGERSELKPALAPTEDKTGGCFAFAR